MAIGKEEALPQRSSYLWDTFGFRVSTWWITVVYLTRAGSHWPQIFRFFSLHPTCWHKTVTRSTFAFWMASVAAGNSLFTTQGVPRRVFIQQPVLQFCLRAPPGCLQPRLFMAHSFLRKSPSRSLRPSVWFLSSRQTPTPSLDFCNKTINTDRYKMQPNTFDEANGLRGRARHSAANGNKIAPSAFFKMHGCVLGPLNMCMHVCHNPCVCCCRWTRKHGWYTMRGGPSISVCDMDSSHAFPSETRGSVICIL